MPNIYLVCSLWERCFHAGVVADLVNRGRQIDAVHFAHAFQLMESFPPVPLLKAYLEDLKNAEKNGNADGQVSTSDIFVKFM